MSNNNEEQKNNFVTNKRKTNNVMNQRYKYKKQNYGTRCITLEKTEDKDYKLNTVNNRKISLSKSYNNFNEYRTTFDNNTNKEINLDFLDQQNMNFVPRINRHKKNLTKFINVNKKDDNKKTLTKHKNNINKTYNNFNSFYKRRKRYASTEANLDKINDIQENYKEYDLINKRLRYSCTNVNGGKKLKKEHMTNLTYTNDYPVNMVCKLCFDRKMLDETMPSFSNSINNRKEILIERFIKENPFYFVDKMNNIEKKRIQSKLDYLSNKQRRVLPIYEREVNKPKNLKKERLQLINEYSLNPLAIVHDRDPKFLQLKESFDKKEKIIQNNPDIYPGLGRQRKAFQDYYEKCMYQVPLCEELYKINPVYKKNYVKALKKQVEDKKRKERELLKKTKTAECFANKQFNEYNDKERMNDYIKSSQIMQVIKLDNKELEEYKKYKKENLAKEKEKLGYRLDLMKEKQNKDDILRNKKERDIDLEIYRNMFDEMNRKAERKIFNRLEEKKRWNNYTEKYNLRYGYLNRYNNCDVCNRPINNKNISKRFPPSKGNVVNIN